MGAIGFKAGVQGFGATGLKARVQGLGWRVEICPDEPKLREDKPSHA